jgi:hypothetical protein
VYSRYFETRYLTRRNERVEGAAHVNNILEIPGLLVIKLTRFVVFEEIASVYSKVQNKAAF